MLNDFGYWSFKKKGTKTQLTKLSQPKGIHSFLWKGMNKYKKKIAGKQTLSPVYLENCDIQTFVMKVKCP